MNRTRMDEYVLGYAGWSRATTRLVTWVTCKLHSSELIDDEGSSGMSQ